MTILLNYLNLFTRKQYEELEIEVLALRKQNISLEQENTRLKEKAKTFQETLNKTNSYYKGLLYKKNNPGSFTKGKSKAA